MFRRGIRVRRRMQRRRIMVGIVAFLLLLILLARILARVGADEGIKAELTSPVDTMTVGDPVTLTLTVTHPEGTRVIFPDLNKTWGDFEVRSQSAPTITHNDDGTETTSQQIEVTLFSTGSFQTPALSVQVVNTDASSQNVDVPTVSLTVLSILQDGDTDLRDIKPQANLPVPSLLPYIIAAAAAGLAVLTLLAYLWRRYRRNRKQQAPGIVRDLRPAYQIAFDELTKIESMKLPDSGLFKEYYTLVSDTLRRYLEGAYSISAIDRTTGEIRRALKHSRLDKDHSRLLLDLLSDADLVKFAKYTPEPDEARSLMAQARRFVELTRVAPDMASDTPPMNLSQELTA